MKTLVINLKKSTDRHEQMSNLLKGHPSLWAGVEFIEAVDGREMSPEEHTQRFNVTAGNLRCKGKLRPGEIGCTLSHQKCYHKIVEEKLPCALILEDDIQDCAELDALATLLQPLLDTPKPTAILLSGKFWWTTSRPVDAEHRLGRVFDGYLTHAYLINLAGAKSLLDEQPDYIADNWRYLIRSKGLHLYGLIPHAVDQNREAFTTTISATKRERLNTIGDRLRSRILREPFKNMRKQLLAKIGHFEPKD